MIHGIHVRPHMLRLVIQTKGIARIILITGFHRIFDSAGELPKPTTWLWFEGHWQQQADLMPQPKPAKHTGYFYTIRFCTINPPACWDYDQLAALNPERRRTWSHRWHGNVERWYWRRIDDWPGLIEELPFCITIFWTMVKSWMIAL